MRILVTGAGGFVGRHLLPALTERCPGAEILTPAFDVTDRAAVEQAVRTARPDALIHLAAVSAIPAARQDPDRAWQVNLHGTLNLARAVLASAPACGFVFVGSSDSYGASFRAGTSLTEDAPLAPQNTYAATKAAAELALGALVSDGLRAIRFRPFNHTGPGQTDAFVIPAFARQVARIAAGQQPPVMQVGALDPQRDFLDVRDVCAAYAEAVVRAPDLEPGVVMNLSSGTPRRIGDVLEGLFDLAGTRAELRTDPARLRSGELMLACGDASRARRLLDWEPRIAWRDTLASVLADWQARVATAGTP